MSDLMRAVIDTLYPDGAIWNPAPDGDFDNLLDGQAANWETIRVFLADLKNVRVPELTTFLADLEREFGVLTNTDLTETQRRDQLTPLVFDRNSTGSVDALQNALDSAGFNVQVHENSPAFDPAIYLDEFFDMVAGGGNAFAGRSDAFAGRTGGELLVNGNIFSTERIFTAVAGASNAFAGTGFSAGEYNDLARVKVEYEIPTDPDDWPMVFFVGGAKTENPDNFKHDAGSDLDVSGQDAQPFGVSISADGLKLFVVGIGSDKVYSYSLGTANDLSTASYDGAPSDLDVSGQDIIPTGVSISADGLKLFVVGVDNNKVYSYSLSIANDLSTASYDGAPSDLDVSGQDILPRGVLISADGLKLFVVGDFNNKVYSYSLGTANDLSTASYDGAPSDLDVSGQDVGPRGVSISADGLKLFVVGDDNNKVYSYTLGPQAPTIEIGSVPAIQENEFKRLVLKFKPIHSWAALILEFI